MAFPAYFIKIKGKDLPEIMQIIQKTEGRIGRKKFDRKEKLSIISLVTEQSKTKMTDTVCNRCIFYFMEEHDHDAGDEDQTQCK